MNHSHSSIWEKDIRHHPASSCRTFIILNHDFSIPTIAPFSSKRILHPNIIVRRLYRCASCLLSPAHCQHIVIELRSRALIRRVQPSAVLHEGHVGSIETHNDWLHQYLAL